MAKMFYLIKTKDPSLEYDDNSRLLTQITPTTKTSYSYDNNGNTLSTINTDIDNKLISSYSYEYNSLNNTTKEEITDKKGITSKLYSYNETNEISELKEIDTIGLITTTSYEFDIYGNKTKELKEDPDGIVTTSTYLYNKDNQLTEKLVDSKVTESYKYDDNGNLISKSTNEGKFTYTYSLNNKLEDTYINGKLETSYYYNTSGLKSYELIRKEYPYDYDVDDSYYVNYKKFMNEIKDNNPSLTASIKDKVSNQETRPKTFFSAIVDFFINIFKAICSFFINIYYFITGNKPKEDTKQDNIIDKEDNNEETEEKPSFFKRLISLFHTENDIQVIFEPSKYTYDYTYSNPLILSEGYDSNNYKSSYIYLNNRLIEDTKTNKTYLYDGKYSISEVISKDNTLSLRYDTYGNITNTILTQEDKTFAYNTQEYTPQNRLYYIKARYYDSTTGTFITKDTYLGNIYKPITTNRYAYCSGDPVNQMDIDGHSFRPVVDNGGGGSKSVPWTPVGDINDWPSSKKPSSGGSKKPSNAPSGAYTSDGFDGGSSYIYIPPPPNPVEKYQKPSFFDKLKANVASAFDNIKNEFNKTTNTIKKLSQESNSPLSNAKNSLLALATEVHFAVSTVATVTNCAVKSVTDAFADVIPENVKTVAKNVTNFVQNSNAAKVVIGVVGIGIGVAATVATGGTAASVILPAIAKGLGTAAIGAYIGAAISTVDYIGSATVNDEEITSSNVIDASVSGAASGFMYGGIAYGSKSVVDSINKKINTSGSAHDIGKKGEDYVSKKLGMEHNDQKIEINGRQRIPDYYDENRGIISEVKNTKTQGFTQQIKDYVAEADRIDTKLTIYTRKDTKISSVLQEQFDSGRIIHEYLGW